MERGSINGIPVWLKKVDYTGGERTIIKEAPGIDGALVETQANSPDRFKLEFELIRDGEWIVRDVEAASLELRGALLNGGPFLVGLPVFGEVADLYLAEPYQVSFFDAGRRSLTAGSLSLIQGEPTITLAEDATAQVAAAIAAMSRVIIEDFSRSVPVAGFSAAGIARLNALTAWLFRTSGAIGNAFQPVNSFAASIAAFKSGVQALLNAPQNFASSLMSAAMGLLSLIPGLSKNGSTTDGSAAVQDLGGDKATAVYVAVLADVFDAGEPPTRFELIGDEAASAEDRAEQVEVETAKALGLATITASVSYAVTSTTFASVTAVLELAEALEPVFEDLLAIPSLDYRVYAEARRLWKATHQYLSEEAARLPRLLTIVLERDTDVLDLLPDLYESLPGEAGVQAAIDSLMALNEIADPTNLRRGQRLRYLDRLVS